MSGQPLSNIALTGGWSWVEGNMRAGAAGTQNYLANFTPTDTVNYRVAQNVNLTVTITAAPTSINEIQKSGRYGILLAKSIVSDKADIKIILPDSDRVSQVKVVIYDNTGNAVFEKTQSGAELSWDLTNLTGRKVANGSYLIVAEAKGANGTYAYSVKVGVKR